MYLCGRIWQIEPLREEPAESLDDGQVGISGPRGVLFEDLGKVSVDVFRRKIFDIVRQDFSEPESYHPVMLLCTRRESADVRKVFTYGLLSGRPCTIFTPHSSSHLESLGYGELKSVMLMWFSKAGVA